MKSAIGFSAQGGPAWFFKVAGSYYSSALGFLTDS